jgi:hypothetical protein
MDRFWRSATLREDHPWQEAGYDQSQQFPLPT